MANHPSALKRSRQAVKHRKRNRARKSEINSLTKKVMGATKDEAQKLSRQLQSKVDKASRKGTLHWKTAARKVSKLAKSLAAGKAAISS